MAVGLLNLPTEVHETIASLLTWKRDKSKFLRSCKSLYLNPTLISFLYKSLFTPLIPPPELIERHHDHIQSINFHNMNSEKALDQFTRAAALAHCFVNLRSFAICDQHHVYGQIFPMSMDWIANLPHPSKLQDLVLFHIPDSALDDAPLWDHIAALPNLRYSLLDKVPKGVDFSAWKKIESLVVTSNRQDDSISKMAKSLPSLKSLTIHNLRVQSRSDFEFFEQIKDAKIAKLEIWSEFVNVQTYRLRGNEGMAYMLEAQKVLGNGICLYWAYKPVK
ncbi:hypothetical protein HDU97_002492 [Phlyctochytrium planicorne]|nr:hypothetical protein HDU97_002492 [Phlyctochytrium planicorne]